MLLSLLALLLGPAGGGREDAQRPGSLLRSLREGRLPPATSTRCVRALATRAAVPRGLLPWLRALGSLTPVFTVPGAPATEQRHVLKEHFPHFPHPAPLSPPPEEEGGPGGEATPPRLRAGSRVPPAHLPIVWNSPLPQAGAGGGLIPLPLRGGAAPSCCRGSRSLSGVPSQNRQALEQKLLDARPMRSPPRGRTQRSLPVPSDTGCPKVPSSAKSCSDPRTAASGRLTKGPSGSNCFSPLYAPQFCGVGITHFKYPLCPSD